jgi:hypothetical protein
MKTKTAYVIRTGEATEGRNISNKLRSRSGVRAAIRAAKRMGFKNAYAAKLQVSADSRLK